jgi:hypothetical protein
MSVEADAVLAPVISALRAYERRLRRLEVELRDVLPGLPPPTATEGAGWTWLRELLAPQRVPVEAFMRPGNRLGVVEPALLRRVLAVRALYASRTAVRRCIDRRELSVMRSAVGASSLVALQLADTRDGETSLPLSTFLDTQSLVQQGMLLLRADGCIDSPGIWHLMTLHTAGGQHHADGLKPTAGTDGPLFLERVAALVPELSW